MFPQCRVVLNIEFTCFQELALRDKLNCALTAFKILSGQGQYCIHCTLLFLFYTLVTDLYAIVLFLGEALNIDPRGFYCTLYTGLLQLNAGIIHMYKIQICAGCYVGWFNIQRQ